MPLTIGSRLGPYDGRFLMWVVDGDLRTSPITVIQNWQEELKQRVPTK